MVPMAYWRSKNLPRGGKKTQENPYKWCKTTIAKILAQQEYCGDVINFKSYSVSFKNKKRIPNDPSNWKIFKNVHDPIIDRDTFEREEWLESFARAIYPDIFAFFESEEGQREYEEWLKTEEGQKAINKIK